MNKVVFAHRIRTDYALQSFLGSVLSFLISIAYLIYNFFLGACYNSPWNFCLGFYYLVLVFLRGFVLFRERKWKHDDASTRREKRAYLFRAVTRTLLLLDFVLIAPITLMVLSQRTVTMSMIPAIATAAYTTYKATLAIMHYCRTRKQDNLSLFCLRIVNLKDAIVSILTLQNTMVMVFGDRKNMLTLTAYTSAGILIGMIVLTLLLIRKGKLLT